MFEPRRVYRNILKKANKLLSAFPCLVHRACLTPDFFHVSPRRSLLARKWINWWQSHLTIQLSVLSWTTSKSSVISASEEAWADVQQTKFANRCLSLCMNGRSHVRQIAFYFYCVSCMQITLKIIRRAKLQDTSSWAKYAFETVSLTAQTSQLKETWLELFLLCPSQHQQDYLEGKDNRAFIFLGVPPRTKRFGPFQHYYYFFSL